MRVLGVLFVLVLWKGSAHAEIRGVRPDLEKVYVKALAEGTWRCLDGSRTLSASVINDDWCHCADGSDEPGEPTALSSAAAATPCRVCRAHGSLQHQMHILYSLTWSGCRPSHVALCRQQPPDPPADPSANGARAGHVLP
jgi:hypothetical protein